MPHRAHKCRSSDFVPRVAATTLAWTNRSAPLPKSLVDDNSKKPPSVNHVSERISRQRFGKVISRGDVCASTRLDRVMNLENLLRTRILSKVDGNLLAARDYLTTIVRQIGAPTLNKKTKSIKKTAIGNSATQDMGNSVRSQDVAKLEQKQLMIFIDLLKTLAGGQWKNTAHISDMEFMFKTYLKYDINRLITRVFPEDLVFGSKSLKNSSRIHHQDGEGDGLPKTRSIDVVQGPFDSFTLKKDRAIKGIRVDSSCSRNESSSQAGVTEERESKKGAQNEHTLVRYRQSKSLVPVPSWWRRGGNFEYLSQRSSREPPPITIEPLHLWCGAGRVDGRAIPIVTQVLQTSPLTREQIYVSGCLIVTEKPVSMLLLRYEQAKAQQQLKLDREARLITQNAATKQTENSTIHAKTIHANTTIPSETMLNETMLNEHMDSEKAEFPCHSQQRRYRGHLHQVTAFSVSPCGQFIASASIGPSTSSSVLLAWKVKDGSPVEPRPVINPEFLVDEKKDPLKAAVAKAGGDCLIALGVFPSGVACLAWSPDSSQIITTSRDWKNAIRCFHVRKNGSNYDLCGHRPVELFSQPTMHELAPVVRCIQWFDHNKFVSLGEKGHFAIWSFEFNPLCMGADKDISKVQLKTRNGSVNQKDGERAVTQSCVLIYATLPQSLAASLTEPGSKSTLDEEGGSLNASHKVYVAMIVAGSTAGALYMIDPESNPNKSSIKCCHEVHEAHKGAGGDGRVQAMPFRGAVEGITSIVTLETRTVTTITTKNKQQKPGPGLSKMSSFRDTPTSRSATSSSTVDFDEKCVYTVRRSLSQVIHSTVDTTIIPHPETTKNSLEEGAATVVPEPENDPLANKRKEKDNVLVTSLVVTGGGDGYLRIWRLTAKYTITKPKAGEPPPLRPFALKKSELRLEPLSELTLNLNASLKRSLPLPSFYLPRKQALADVGLRPCGVKAIALLSPSPSSKRSALYELYDRSQWKEDENEVENENVFDGGSAVPNVNILVSTTGGTILSFLPHSSPLNAATDSGSRDPPIWSLQAVTSAGHFKGPSVGLAHHPAIPGLFFSVATDRQLCAWYSSAGVESVSDVSCWNHDLVACLTLKRHPSALAVSPHIIKVNDDFAQSENVALLKQVSLAVGFADGSLLEISLTFKQLNDAVMFEEGGAPEECRSDNRDVDAPLATIEMSQYEAYYWEERCFYAGFRQGEGLKTDDNNESIGQYGLNNQAKVGEGASPYHKVSSLAYSGGGFLLCAGRSNGRVQVRVAASHHFQSMKASTVVSSLSDSVGIVKMVKANTGALLEEFNKTIIKIQTSNFGETLEGESEVRWLQKKYLHSRQKLLLDFRVGSSVIQHLDFSNAEVSSPGKVLDGSLTSADQTNSRMFDQSENVVFACVLKTSDQAAEVKYHRLTLRTCVAFCESHSDAAHLGVWRVTMNMRTAEQCCDATFPSWTCPFGFQVMGIWNASSKAQGAPLADVTALHYNQRPEDAIHSDPIDHKSTCAFVGTGLRGDVRNAETECEKDRQGLIVVGDSKGALRVLSSPALAQSSRAVVVPNAHVSVVAAIRSCEMPCSDLPNSSIPTNTFASLKPKRTVLVASLGAGDNVLALWLIRITSSPDRINHQEKGSQDRDYGPLRCFCLPLPGTKPELTAAEDAFQSDRFVKDMLAKSKEDLDNSATKNGNENSLMSSKSGPRMLICYVCGQPSMLSAYVLHVVKCGQTFKTIQEEKQRERNLPGERAAPMGPATPHNNDLFKSGCLLMEWQTSLPVPSPPEGIHERFTRCLRTIQIVEKDEGDDGPPEGGHLMDTKALKKLSDSELEEANRDARKAYWLGNTLMCPICLCRVHWERCRQHARYCISSTAKLRRREDALVETDHYTHALTSARPPAQVRPGTSSMREALLFSSIRESHPNINTASSIASESSVIAIRAGYQASTMSADLWAKPMTNPQICDPSFSVSMTTRGAISDGGVSAQGVDLDLGDL